MKKTTISASIFGAMAAAALGLAGAAAAAPTGGSSAADTVSSLQARGYNVQLNGSATGPLSQCTVSGVHGDSAARLDSTQFATAYVDISCPSTNN